MLSSHLSHLQCSILYPGENHVQDSDQDPGQDGIKLSPIHKRSQTRSYRIIKDCEYDFCTILLRILKNRRQIIITLPPPFLPLLPKKKITGRHGTLEVQIWAEFLNCTASNRS